MDDVQRPAISPGAPRRLVGFGLGLLALRLLPHRRDRRGRSGSWNRRAFLGLWPECKRDRRDLRRSGDHPGGTGDVPRCQTARTAPDARFNRRGWSWNGQDRFPDRRSDSRHGCARAAFPGPIVRFKNEALCQSAADWRGPGGDRPADTDSHGTVSKGELLQYLPAGGAGPNGACSLGNVSEKPHLWIRTGSVSI